MEVPQVLHMNGGDGEISYYKNSTYQKHVIFKAKPTLEESTAQVYEKSSPECLNIVDMGCSSGPNTLLPLWEMIEAIESTCNRLNKKPPTLQVFLNDLQGTDFNTIFRSLVPNFHEKLEKEKGTKFRSCFIAAMPGSFYGRLFPQNSLHLVHSSCGLHWCSQVPQGLVSENGIPLNKGNICVAQTSPAIVHELYLDQFKRDFTTFLKLRSEEMVSGGGMVLTFHVQSSINPFCKFSVEIWQLIGISLQDMVNEGIIPQLMLDSYNIPLYAPPLEEVRHLIKNEGSFDITRLEEFELRWDANFEDGNKELAFDKWEIRGKHVAKQMRAIAESMLASHFGDAVIEDLFFRLSLKISDYLEKGIGLCNNMVISLTKK